MAVYFITVTKDSVDTEELTVLRRDTVAWIPATDDVKVKVKFIGASPFKRKEFPDKPGAGEGASGLVRKDAEFISYPYKQPGSQRRRRGARPLGDPVIIVKDNRRKKAKKKGGSKKSARKK